MRRGLTVSAFVSTLVLLSVLACGGSYQGSSVPGPARDAQAPTSVLTGTCREYDVQARTLDVVTGTSFALRTVLFKIHSNTEITVGGRSARFTDLQANTVVRVEYRATSQGNLADKITVVLDARGMR